MTTLPAPDVDRVLDRMGRSTIGYRSFPRPVEKLADVATRNAPETRDHAAPVALFSLVGDALPAATAADTAASLVAPPLAASPHAASPVAASTIAASTVAAPPVAASSVAASPIASSLVASSLVASSPVASSPVAPVSLTLASLPTSAAPAAPGNPVRLASMTEMFRSLLGDPARAPLRGEALAQDTAFPFRRR